MIQYLRHVSMEILTSIGIRKVPLCSNCKYYMKTEKKCSRIYKIDFITGEYQNTKISDARNIFNCGYVGYYYEKKEDDPKDPPPPSGGCGNVIQTVAFL